MGTAGAAAEIVAHSRIAGASAGMSRGVFMAEKEGVIHGPVQPRRI
jgi:hypothetical protein